MIKRDRWKNNKTINTLWSISIYDNPDIVTCFYFIFSDYWSEGLRKRYFLALFLNNYLL